MAGKVQARRDELKARLVEIAANSIANNGLQSLRARDLAKEAGCSVGAIYNVFDDLDDLVLTVNGQTFRAMGTFIAGQLAEKPPEGPTERLITMSYAYLNYAVAHPKTWRALFDVQMSTDMDPPQWYLDELNRLFAIIAEQVAQCFADMPREDVGLMTRALFSSVHGIVLLGIENRISAVPQPHLRRMISMMLTEATKKT
jgi:AcrR family transcriptional regulator